MKYIMHATHVNSSCSEHMTGYKGLHMTCRTSIPPDLACVSFSLSLSPSLPPSLPPSLSLSLSPSLSLACVFVF